MNLSVKNNWKRTTGIIFLGLLVLVFASNLVSAQTTPAGQPSAAQPPGGSASAPPGGAAQTSPATPAVSALGTSIIEATGWLAFPAIAVIGVVLLALNGILTAVLAIAGGILDLAWQANVTLDPSNMVIVQQGWRIVRDISNAFFILIVLWIAFTIIFNLERFDGKKLLVRTVIIAFLINFSLVFVTIVFGFTNSLANEFAKKIPTGDIAGTFMSSTQLHTVFNRLGQGDARALTDAKSRAEAQSSAAVGNTGAGTGSSAPAGGEPGPVQDLLRGPNLKQTFVAALGVPQADAQVLSGLAGCGIGFVVGGPAGCAVGGIGAALMSVINSLGGGLFTTAYKLVISLALSNLLFLLTIAAFLLAGVALLVRLVAEILLSILAPAALMVHIIPGKATAKYWDQWIEALFRYAFFAPMFYFLLYLTLYILQTSNQRIVGSGPSATNAASDFDRFVQVFIAFALIYAAVKLSRKTGGVAAEAAIGAGKFIGSQALGFAGRAALPRLGALAGRMDQGLAGMGDVTIRGRRLPTVLQPRNLLGKAMGGYPSRGLQAITRLGRKQEDEAGKGLEGLTSKEIKRGFATGAFRTQADRSAAIRKLLQFQDLSMDDKIPGFIPEHLRAAVEQIKATGGDYKPILRGNPSIAKLEDFSAEDVTKGRENSSAKLGRSLGDNDLAQWIAWEKVRPEHIKSVDIESSLKTSEQKEIFLAVSSSENLSALARHNPTKATELNNFLNAPDPRTGNKENAKTIIPLMDANKYTFLQNSTSRGGEWSIPLEDEFMSIAFSEREERTTADNLKKLQTKLINLKAGSKNKLKLQNRIDDTEAELKRIQARLGRPTTAPPSGGTPPVGGGTPPSPPTTT